MYDSPGTTGTAALAAAKDEITRSREKKDPILEAIVIACLSYVNSH